MEMKFYKCKHCGKIIAIVQETAVPTICCGEPMTLLVAGSVDASVEKHVPVVSRNGNTVTVTVGSVEHPMTADHYIQWISLQTKHGNRRKALKTTDKPSVTLALLDGDEIEAVYAYCNLHGLWKA